jgi:hypothetical protein
MRELHDHFSRDRRQRFFTQPAGGVRPPGHCTKSAMRRTARPFFPRQATEIFHATGRRRENPRTLHEKRDAANGTAIFHATGARNFSRNRQAA